MSRCCSTAPSTLHSLDPWDGEPLVMTVVSQAGRTAQTCSFDMIMALT